MIDPDTSNEPVTSTFANVDVDPNCIVVPSSVKNVGDAVPAALFTSLEKNAKPSAWTDVGLVPLKIDMVLVLASLGAAVPPAACPIAIVALPVKPTK